MPAAYVTAAELAQVSGSQFLQGLFDFTRTSVPILNSFGARGITGTRFKSLAVGAYPTEPSFVRLNEGYTSSKGLFTLGEFAMSRMNAMVKVQESSCMLWDAENVTGAGDYFTLQAYMTFKAAMLHMEKQIIYGTTVDAKGFPGMKQLTPALTANTLTYATPTAPESDGYIRSFINAGGTTATTASSVYAVKFGPLDTQLLYGGPQGIAGFLNMSPKERVLQSVTDPVDSIVKDDWFLVSSGEGYVGLSVAGSNESTRAFPQQSLRRIGNLTNDSGKSLNEAKLDYLLESFPPGQMPDALYMSPRSLRQLRDSKPAQTVFVNSGSNAMNGTYTQPLPDNHRGVPIIVSERILNTDAIEVPA